MSVWVWWPAAVRAFDDSWDIALAGRPRLAVLPGGRGVEDFMFFYQSLV
jgi:hypothetical protein